MEIRAGLHSGECELMRDAARVGGLAVHIGARVLSKAGPSEVLVSSTIRGLVVSSGLKFPGPRPAGAQGRAGGTAVVRGRGLTLAVANC
jgi:class 3 adenylate cyclase